MAEKLSKIRIYVSDITLNGVVCTNPTVEFDETCFTISCEGTDSSGRDWIEIQPLPDCDKQCVDVKICCPNECDVEECCDVKRYCLCDDKTDCAECEECTGGFCEERCPDLKCLNDECVDCLVDGDCPCNQVCVGNDCKCPAGTKLNPETNCCEECLTDSDCDICEECVGFNCQPKCPDACDDKGNCVDCVNSGDCAGRPDNRACCGDDGCECCTGYCYDPVQSKCVICPPCTKDEHCPECYNCIGDECVPVVCPTGYICVGDECVPECDCDNPTCSRVAACIPYTGDKCICVECEGDCDSGCSIGCYCNPETDQCEPNPCDKPCTSGADCGLGCGCDPDTNRCVPCDTLDCTTSDCDRVEGCKCYGSACIGDPCNGPCEDANDCDSPNCGCDPDTNTCVSCDKLTCDDCDTVLGCECTNGVNCEPVSPCSGPCTTPSDCPDGCTCYQGECVPCAYFDCDNCPNGCDCTGGACGKTDTPELCADTFTLEKDSDDGEPCDLIATLITEECCSCPKIEVRSKLNSPVSNVNVDVLGNTVTGKNLIYNIQLFKSGVKLSNTGILNELPQGGVFEAAADVKYSLTSGGVSTSGTLTNYATITGDISGSDDLSLSALAVPDLGVLIDNGTTRLEILSVTIKITLTEDLTFPNECEYDAVVEVASFTSYTPGIINSKELASDQCRLPIFDWYRNTTGTAFGSGNRFRRVYAQRLTSNSYTDKITDCSDGLYSGFHYRVTSDCTCAPAPIKQAIFCQDVLNFQYALSNCGRTLTVLNLDDPCDVNGNLTAQGCTSIPSGAQVEWILKITTTAGIEVNTNYVLPSASLTSGTVFNTTGDILLVEFYHSQDTSCKISETENGGIDFTADATCDDGGTITVLLPTSGSYSIVINDGTSNVATRTGVFGTQDFTGLGYGGTFTVTVTSGACVSDTTVAIPSEESCCDNFTCAAAYNGTSVSISISPFDASETYVYTVNGSVYVLGTAITLANGTHTFTATDSTGCGCSGTFTVDNCPGKVISANRSYTASTDTFSVTNITGGTAPYSINIGGIVANNVPASGTNINVAALAEGTYTVTITDSEGCTGTFTIEIDRPDPCDGSNLSIAFTPADYDCTGDTMDITPSGGTAPYTLVVEDSMGSVGGALVDNGDGTYTVNSLLDDLHTVTATDADGCTSIRQFIVDCNCNNPLIFDTISADCNNNDHVISIPGGITGGDSSPLIVTVSSATAGGGTVFYNNAVNPGDAITVTIPESSALTAGALYYIYVEDNTSKCIAEDTVAAPDCTFECDYELDPLACSGDGAAVWFTTTPSPLGAGTNNCTILGGTVTVDNVTVNGSAANVDNAYFTGGQVVIIPDQSLMCPAQTVTEVVVTITINDLFGDGCECVATTPTQVTKTFTTIPSCIGSCP